MVDAIINYFPVFLTSNSKYVKNNRNKIEIILNHPPNNLVYDEPKYFDTPKLL